MIPYIGTISEKQSYNISVTFALPNNFSTGEKTDITVIDENYAIFVPPAGITHLKIVNDIAPFYLTGTISCIEQVDEFSNFLDNTFLICKIGISINDDEMADQVFFHNFFVDNILINNVSGKEVYTFKLISTDAIIFKGHIPPDKPISTYSEEGTTKKVDEIINDAFPSDSPNESLKITDESIGDYLSSIDISYISPINTTYENAINDILSYINSVGNTLTYLFYNCGNYVAGEDMEEGYSFFNIKKNLGEYEIKDFNTFKISNISFMDPFSLHTTKKLSLISPYENSKIFNLLSSKTKMKYDFSKNQWVEDSRFLTNNIVDDIKEFNLNGEEAFINKVTPRVESLAYDVLTPYNKFLYYNEDSFNDCYCKQLREYILNTNVLVIAVQCNFARRINQLIGLYFSGGGHEANSLRAFEGVWVIVKMEFTTDRNSNLLQILYLVRTDRINPEELVRKIE